MDLEEDLDTHFSEEKSYFGIDAVKENLLDVLDKNGIRATFFATGSVVEQKEETIKEIAFKHEIGCHGGMQHKTMVGIPLKLQRYEIESFQNTVKHIQTTVSGYRAINNVLCLDTLRLLDELNFIYDSSVIPRYPPLKRNEGYKGRSPTQPYHPSLIDYRKKGNMKIIELPISTLQLVHAPICSAWIRYLGYKIVAFLMDYDLDYYNILLHSWDFVHTKKYGKGTGKEFLCLIDNLIYRMLDKGYIFQTASAFVLSNEKYSPISLDKRIKS